MSGTAEPTEAGRLHPVSQSMAKRLFDLGVGVMALAALSPVLLLAAAAIKLTSRGPLFFVQLRRGRNAKVFKIWKLRTFNDDCCDAPGQSHVRGAEELDSRIFPVGRFLRKRGLDEIPQLWNVLRGDMTIIGPRPHALPHDDLYRAKIPGYAARYCVRPGITGWAQVNGSLGTIRTLREAEQRLRLDREYIDRWSLLLDLAITLRTIAIVVFGSHMHQTRPKHTNEFTTETAPAAPQAHIGRADMSARAREL